MAHTLPPRRMPVWTTAHSKNMFLPKVKCAKSLSPACLAPPLNGMIFSSTAWWQALCSTSSTFLPPILSWAPFWRTAPLPSAILRGPLGAFFSGITATNWGASACSFSPCSSWALPPWALALCRPTPPSALPRPSSCKRYACVRALGLAGNGAVLCS